MSLVFCYINHQKIVKTITDSILTLFKQDTDYYSENSTKTINLTQLKPLIEFAIALKDMVPTVRLIELFDKIRNPGFNLIYQLITRLLADNLLINAQHSKQIQHLLSLIQTKALSQLQRVDYAIIFARLKRTHEAIDEAIAVIADTYEKDETITDGYTKLAWEFFHRSGDYRTALELMLRDYKSNRISQDKLNNIAVEFAFNDRIDEAEAITDKMYNLDGSLRDVLAKTGWTLAGNLFNFNDCLSWSKKDEEREKLSLLYRLKTTQCLSALGMISDAIETTRTVNWNKQNASLPGRFAFAAHGCRYAGLFDEAEHLFDMDSRNGHLSTTGKLWQAQNYLLTKEYEKAENLIRKNNVSPLKVVLEINILYFFNFTAYPNWQRLIRFVQDNEFLMDELEKEHSLFFISRARCLAGEPKKALNMFRKTRATPKINDADYVANLMMWLAMTDNLEMLPEPASVASLENTNNAYSLMMLAYVFAELNQPERATEALEILRARDSYFFLRLWKTSPSFYTFVAMYGITARKFGDNALAKKSLSLAETGRQWFFWKEVVQRSETRRKSGKNLLCKSGLALPEVNNQSLC